MLIKTLISLLASTSFLYAQNAGQVELGQLQTGAVVSFVRSGEGHWGINITGGPAPVVSQAKPVKLEILQGDNDINNLAAGYNSAEKTPEGVKAVARLTYGTDVVFDVQDNWSMKGAVVTVCRAVNVTGNAAGGFSSSIILTLDPAVGWFDLNCMAPGALYGDPTFDGERSPGGTRNHAARYFLMREDILPAPLFALAFGNGASVAILDPKPQGDTTVAETKLTQAIMTDARLKFGSLGAWQTGEEPIEFGFQYPGSMNMSSGGPTTQAVSRMIRRYHPITQGVEHSYEVSFRFGQNESFRDTTRNTWRWAWDTLKPEVKLVDIELMRRVLTDHLASVANTIDGRTAIPFVINTITDERQWNYNMVAMGFVAKNIECADQLLRESDRDNSERGQKMRQIGLDIIKSLIQALPDVPLMGTGYDLATGKAWTGDHQEWVAPWLRNATEDMRVLMRAYQREKAKGREHVEWLNWVKQYVDWLLLQQRADGSFPRCWKPGSNEVVEETGTTSYCPVPLLVIMTEITGDEKYEQAAIKAAEYVWKNWGTRGLFIGGASDNPNITDKEAGMLSMEAYLSLYEVTKSPKWLERAKAAADFAESWMWIWNLPMPLDASAEQLHWSKDMSVIGAQGITALYAGSVDQYLDWSAPSYAKLYKLTNDRHYLDVARVLLHGSKAMVAMPGRQYDYKGIGLQQEGWRMGPGGSGRGVGGHRFWLPWITANHLYSITGLEELDAELFKELSTEKRKD